MLKRFVSEIEDQPGNAWLSRFVEGRDETTRWYLGNATASPTARECRTALLQYMPELVQHYDRVCALVGDDDFAHRILSQYRPPPTFHGCSQAVWLGSAGPALVRNYDYSLDIVSNRFELTRWSGHEVIAKAQRPWGGCLDGMNQEGLVASLTAGGGHARGLGFSIILVLRYVLETCSRVEQAIEALCRIPIAQSQNVTLLDRDGFYATVFLGPDRAPAVSSSRVCTNHQETIGQSSSSAAVSSIQRHRWLQAALQDPAMTLDSLTAKFFEPPLYSRSAGFSTVYTAVYLPAEGRVSYLWPGNIWHQQFNRFTTGEYTHDYGDLI
jgi:predicted choloylglycine hydrolase